MLFTKKESLPSFEVIKPQTERGDNSWGHPFGGCLRAVRGFDLMRVASTSTSLASAL